MPSSDANSISSSSSLMVRLCARDSVAWEQFVELYAPLISKWCGQCRLKSHATADVLQEVFATVAQTIHRFNSGSPNATFRGWLWTVTRSKVIDQVRQNRRHGAAMGGSSARDQLESFVDPESIPDEEPTTEIDQRQLMMRALNQIECDFAEQTWNAFTRCVIDGMSTEIVSRELDMTHASVRQARSRVLRRLRTHIGETTENDQ